MILWNSISIEEFLKIEISHSSIVDQLDVGIPFENLSL